MRGMLIVNARSGTATPSTDELSAAARELGVEVQLLEPGDDLAQLARDADADVLGMAGGDGSLAPVAQAAIERGLPFVCVPFGTRNHFARDVGLDRGDPLAALGAFRDDAEERTVDVGRAGDGIFLNNVSLGLYAGLVHDREQRRRRDETFARLKALRLLATAGDPLPLLLDGAPFAAHLILVSNNSYTPPPSVFSLGERERLDEGKLVLYVAGGMLPRHWDTRELEQLSIECGLGEIAAAVDGEPKRFDSPLELSIAPQALRVRLPRREEETA
jgi:diacylglycerol kinase family enzyme